MYNGMKDSSKSITKERESNIELFRIITMLIIVAHHYVVNSGLIGLINESTLLSANKIFLLLFGWGGKIGINCFVLITGFYMCKSKITIKKFIKLLFEIQFYNLIFYMLFLITGYMDFSIKMMIKTLIPFYGIGGSFIPSFMVFFLFIPFLNLLISAMDKKMHISLIALSCIIYTILPTFFVANVIFSYVSWFMILYIIASYIRMYPIKQFNDKKLWGILTILFLLISWVSVVAGFKVGGWINKDLSYFLVNDSNKVLALVLSLCAFMFFKNIKLGTNKTINTIAASTFGVLLIHANSDTMRTWLWKDVIKCTEFYNSQYLVVHAILSVLFIFVTCILIDIIRIRFIEEPLLKQYDRLYNKYSAALKLKIK